jgi:hypothetical protein
LWLLIPPPTCLAGVGARFWLPSVVGDFREGDAREFLELTLREIGSTARVDDSAWAKVFEVRHAPVTLHGDDSHGSRPSVPVFGNGCLQNMVLCLTSICCMHQPPSI